MSSTNNNRQTKTAQRSVYTEHMPFTPHSILSVAWYLIDKSMVIANQRNNICFWGCFRYYLIAFRLLSVKVDNELHLLRAQVSRQPLLFVVYWKSIEVLFLSSFTFFGLNHTTQLMYCRRNACLILMVLLMSTLSTMTFCMCCSCRWQVSGYDAILLSFGRAKIGEKLIFTHEYCAHWKPSSEYAKETQCSPVCLFHYHLFHKPHDMHIICRTRKPQFPLLSLHLKSDFARTTNMHGLSTNLRAHNWARF